MRQAPQMRAEVAGITVFRPGVPDVIQCTTGAVVHMRPQLESGEILIERLGMLPLIVKEQPMADERERRDTYRDEMVRAVLGACPAILSKEANPIAVDSLSRQLVDAENAKAILRANGHGRYTDSLADMVKTMLTGERTKP